MSAVLFTFAALFVRMALACEPLFTAPRGDAAYSAISNLAKDSRGVEELDLEFRISTEMTTVDHVVRRMQQLGKDLVAITNVRPATDDSFVYARARGPSERLRQYGQRLGRSFPDGETGYRRFDPTPAPTVDHVPAEPAVTAPVAPTSTPDPASVPVQRDPTLADFEARAGSYQSISDVRRVTARSDVITLLVLLPNEGALPPSLAFRIFTRGNPRVRFPERFRERRDHETIFLVEGRSGDLKAFAVRVGAVYPDADVSYALTSWPPVPPAIAPESPAPENSPAPEVSPVPEVSPAAPEVSAMPSAGPAGPEAELPSVEEPPAEKPLADVSVPAVEPARTALVDQIRFTPDLLASLSSIRDQVAVQKLDPVAFGRALGNPEVRVRALIADQFDLIEPLIGELAEVRRAHAEESDALLREILEDDWRRATARLDESYDRLVKLADGGRDVGSRVIFLEIMPNPNSFQKAEDLVFLRSVYLNLAERRGWSADIVEESHGNLGLRRTTLRLEGEGVADLMLSEPGVHRIHQTNRDGDHARSLNVFAYSENAESEGGLDRRDLTVTPQRSRGPGGQHVNTTNSAVRVKHVPSGLEVVIETFSSQKLNLETAIQVINGRLLERGRAAAQENITRERRAKAAVAAGEARARTYDLRGKGDVATDYARGSALDDTLARNAAALAIGRIHAMAHPR